MELNNEEEFFREYEKVYDGHACMKPKRVSMLARYDLLNSEVEGEVKYEVKPGDPNTKWVTFKKVLEDEYKFMGVE